MGYWERRYAQGGTSGAGSYGRLSGFKAEVLNAFVQERRVQSVIEFGCGDGNQLTLARYPSYVGLDVSKTAVSLCGRRFAMAPDKSFFIYAPGCFFDRAGLFSADLGISLDVCYHLLEEDVYQCYMQDLFSASLRYVAIYSSNFEATEGYSPHMRHRKITAWPAIHMPDWKPLFKVNNRYPFDPKDPENTSLSDFYFWEK
ncbi:MAG: hypothetical protein JEZ11_22820 [Desulfobacterales bacterium]|nr:hypothetical protein [Desulfobacterales bacterium]